MLLGQGHISKIANETEEQNLFGYLVIMSTKYSYGRDEKEFKELISKGYTYNEACDKSVKKRKNIVSFYRIYDTKKALKHALITINRNHNIIQYTIIKLRMYCDKNTINEMYKYITDKEYIHE